MYTLVLLLHGPRAHEFEGEALDALQAAHLRHVVGLNLDGHTLLNGPLGDDGELRGISIWASTDHDEVRRLVEQDPSVEAGRLRYEIHPWFGIPETRSRKSADAAAGWAADARGPRRC